MRTPKNQRVAKGVDWDEGKKKVYEARPPDRDVPQLPTSYLAPEGVDEPQPHSSLDEGGEALMKGWTKARGLDEACPGSRGGQPLGWSLAFKPKLDHPTLNPKPKRHS